MMNIIIVFRKGSAPYHFEFLNELLGFHKSMYELLVYAIRMNM